MEVETAYGPWPDLVTARSFLSRLIKPLSIATAKPMDVPLPVGALADWLIAHELGPLAYRRWQGIWPELCQLLLADWYAAAAENQLHQENLNQITAAFANASLPVVVLKGSALAQAVYPDPACRPMSDIDLWVAPERMAKAAALMAKLGYYSLEKADRPMQLQALSGGELRFGRTAWQQGMVELHWSAMSGWWLHHTAVPDVNGMWQRRVPLLLAANGSPVAYQLDPEDMIIQLAVHIAVNHQFSATLLRSLADITLTAVSRPVNWQLVADRAREWRVGTAVYLALTLTHQLFDLPASDAARRHLQPTRLRRWLLSQLVSPQTALNRADIRTSLARQLLLLLLVDRPRDMLRLIGRTIWPTAEWREARYGKPTSPLGHLWHIFRTRNL
jgi:hypothetical protein